MTVSYQYEVASSTSGGFTRLLFKWRGSLYKLIYKELFIFCVGYGCMAIIYRYFFTEDQKRKFENAVLYCDTQMNYIPLSFILGFYVSFVASRWWQQYMAIPWPDKIIHAIALHITGYDEKGRMMRRALARYLNLSLVLILRSISSAVKKRFPTLEHLVEAGFITSTELGIFNLVPNKEFNTYWVPCTWFTALLREIKMQKRIPDPMGVKHIMEEFNEFRQKCGLLWSYDWVSIPLVYTQVVTIATYVYFIAAIVGRQYTEKSSVPYKKNLDLYVPFFTILHFFFYMGLLKVAEQLINPFGDDDEDFELNWIIDRHMKVSYLIVDTLLIRQPPLAKDIFYDDECPDLPYTEASAEFKKKTYRGSVANMVIPEEKQNLILPDIQEEGEDDAFNSSYLITQQPSLKSSMSNIGGSKDQRSLSVPDEILNMCAGTPSNSPSQDNRRDSTRSQPVSRSASRRIGTTGSKGIGSALLAIGSHQGFLAADPEKISLAGGVTVSTSTPTAENSGKENDIYTGIQPSSSWTNDDVTVDLSYYDDSIMEDKLKDKSKGYFRLPPSIKAKLAIKKKPVIKWKPYVRQASVDQDLPFPDDLEEALSEEIRSRITEFSRVSKDDTENVHEAPVFVEDECAFMWRTVEEDNMSYKTSMSGQSDDQLLASVIGDGAICSHYIDVKPQHVRPNTLNLPMFGLKPKRSNRRNTGIRRTRYRTRGRMRCQYCSMPLLDKANYSTNNYLLAGLVKSVSENSVFQEAVTRRLNSISQDRSRPISSKSCPSSPDILIPPKVIVFSDKQSSSPDSEGSKDVP